MDPGKLAELDCGGGFFRFVLFFTPPAPRWKKKKTAYFFILDTYAAKLS